MIGKLVEYIVEAGCNVCVINNRKEFLVLRISQEVHGELLSSDWALTREELKVAHASVLIDMCELRLRSLRQVIEEKGKDK